MSQRINVPSFREVQQAERQVNPSFARGPVDGDREAGLGSPPALQHVDPMAFVGAPGGGAQQRPAGPGAAPHQPAASCRPPTTAAAAAAPRYNPAASNQQHRPPPGPPAQQQPPPQRQQQPYQQQPYQQPSYQQQLPSNAIIVSRRQEGNPVLKHLRNVRWQFGDIVPDYLLGQSTAAVFLSLRFHLLKPEYIHHRLKELQRAYRLRVLLCHVDSEDAAEPLAAVTKAAIGYEASLVCAWSAAECARYLETFKSYEAKPAEMIQKDLGSDYVSRLNAALTGVRGVNRTDVKTLGDRFGSVAALLAAGAAELQGCPGVGPTKARRLYETFHEPFRKSLSSPAAAAAAAGATPPSQRQQQQQQQQQQGPSADSAPAPAPGAVSPVGASTAGTAGLPLELEKEDVGDFQDDDDEDDDFI